MIGTPARHIVNNTTIGGSVSTRMASKPAYTLDKKAPGHASLQEC